MKTGAEMIADERRRQVDEEGHHATHDEKHAAGGNSGKPGLVQAAVCYAESAIGEPEAALRQKWPWDAKSWKPKTPIRDLVRAGALIAAELDRRIRAGETH